MNSLDALSDSAEPRKPNRACRRDLRAQPTCQNDTQITLRVTGPLRYASRIAVELLLQEAVECLQHGIAVVPALLRQQSSEYESIDFRFA